MGRYIVDFKPELEIAVFKKIWRFTGGMLLISLVAGLNTQMDKMAISKYLPVEVLGYYTLAVSLSMGIVVLVSPISIALLPKFTALYSNNEKDKASLLYDKYNLIVAVLVFSSMSVLIFFAKEVLWVWTGNLDLANKTSVFLPIISFSFAMLALSVLPYNIAVANGYTKLNNIVGLSSLIITIPGYWIITKYFGAIGAAYVFCTVQLMGTIIYTYVINKKFVKLNLKKMFFKQIFSPLLISLCLAFVLSFIPELFKSNRFLCLLWIGVGSFLILIFSFLILIPSSEIKQLANFKNILKSK
jgi:O-antigen/teichoic acid export membrane protein